MLHGAPWVFMCFHCHQMITQPWSKGPRGLLEVTQKSHIFRQPTQVWKRPSPRRRSPIGGQTRERARDLRHSGVVKSPDSGITAVGHGRKGLSFFLMVSSMVNLKARAYYPTEHVLTQLHLVHKQV